MKTILTIVATMMFAQVSFAADCELTISRKACAGKEIEAMKPYNGQNPTTEKSAAADAEACTKKAEKASKIIRKGTLTEKSVTAKFDGKDIGKSFTDNAECK